MSNYGYPQYYNPDINAQIQQNPIYQQAQQRLNQMYQQYPQFAPQPTMQSHQQPQPQHNPLRCIAVTSIDEARAFIADPLGAITVFANVNGREIYTKQINLNGTAEFKIYKIEESPVANNQTATNNQPVQNQQVQQPLYVTQQDFGILVDYTQKLEKQLQELRESINYEYSSVDEPSPPPAVANPIKPRTKPSNALVTNNTTAKSTNATSVPTNE